MVICKRDAFLLLVLISSAFVCLPHACGCGGGCTISGGGEASYNFIGDRAVDMDMSSFDEFVRDNLGSRQTAVSAISLSHEAMPKANSSLNLTCRGNMSQNCSEVITGLANTSSDEKIVKLGARENRAASMVLAAFNNHML